MTAPQSLLSSAIILFVSAGLCTGQPDAGQLLREQQAASPTLPTKLPTREEEVVAAPSAPQAPALTIEVKAFQFSGYDGIATESELQLVVSDSIGKSLGVAQLQQMADKVSALLRSKGFFLARAYLPKQDVTEGVVKIAVLQAKSEGGVSVKRAPGARIREDILKRIASDASRPGQPLRANDLEKALMLLNEIPGVSARAVLSAGEEPGTTRVTINVTEKPLLSGMVWTDNYGNRYTGQWRGSAMVAVNDPLRFGDQLTAMISGAEGLLQGRVGYSAPVGVRGFRANAAVSAMQYKIVQGLTALRSKGEAQTVELGASYPLVKRRTLSLIAKADYEFKALKDKAYGFTLRDKALHNGRVSLQGEHVDSFAKGGVTTWSAAATVGNVDLSANRADSRADQTGPGTSGMYTRLNVSAARLQRVAEGAVLSASYNGQFASGNLDSSEKFNLGGPYGVRAYPVGEGTGDEGHIFNLEFRKDLPFAKKWALVQVSVFGDSGNITQYKKLWPGALAASSSSNSYWLHGLGVGLSVSKPGLFNIRLSYAHELGDNPGASVSGRDADGRNSNGRVWAMGQVSF